MNYDRMNILDLVAEIHHIKGTTPPKFVRVIRNIRGWLFGWKPPCPPYTEIPHPFTYKELIERN
jgi:hypothetical protein